MTCPFVITPTREQDEVNVEVIYAARGRSMPFRSTLAVPVQARPVNKVKIGEIWLKVKYALSMNVAAYWKLKPEICSCRGLILLRHEDPLCLNLIAGDILLGRVSN